MINPDLGSERGKDGKTFDFDHFESRLPWGQVKWEPAELEKTFGTQDVLPAWIADMDLKTLPEVQGSHH